jgi:uncharacterized protein YkuJ
MFIEEFNYEKQLNMTIEISFVNEIENLFNLEIMKISSKHFFDKILIKSQMRNENQFLE